jgi:lipoprotein signal peptidase
LKGKKENLVKKHADLEFLGLGLLLLIVAIILPTETETCSTTAFGPSCIQTIYTYNGVSAPTAKAILFVIAALCIAGGVILLVLRNLKQSKISTGQSTATITSTPPTRSTALTSSPPSTHPTASVPIDKADRRKYRTTILVVVGSFVLILVIIIGVAIINQAQTTATFHQEVTTGPHITSIEVGTGISNSGLQQQGETFQAGNPSCISLNVHNGSSPGYIDAVLSQGNTTVFSGSVVRGLSPYWQGPFWICSQYNILNPGVYQWVVNYNGSAEASITFQVTP